MLHSHVQVTIYREYAIEELKQALSNLQSYDSDQCIKHLNDALTFINEMNKVNEEY